MKSNLKLGIKLYSNSSILSQPLRLVWNGWESNTYALQREGWELSAREDIQNMRMSIALRHNNSGMRGLTEFLPFDYFQKRGSIDVYDSNPNNYPTFGCQLANDITIQTVETMGTTVEFNPIDARPMHYNRVHLDEIAHFRKLEKSDNEIFLKPASMDDILNMALERQEPRQDQIRKEMVRRKEMDVMRNSQLKAHLRLVV